MHFGKEELKISLKDKKEIHKQERANSQINLKNLYRNPIQEDEEIDDGDFFQWDKETELEKE